MTGGVVRVMVRAQETERQKTTERAQRREDETSLSPARAAFMRPMTFVTSPTPLRRSMSSNMEWMRPVTLAGGAVTVSNECHFTVRSCSRRTWSIVTSSAFFRLFNTRDSCSP